VGGIRAARPPRVREQGPQLRVAQPPLAVGYLSIPIVGPMIGGLIGAHVYDLTTHDVLVARGETPADVEERGRTVKDDA
jgi:hypothetical protein